MKKALVVLLGCGIAASGCAHRTVNPDAVVVRGMVLDGKGKDRGQIVRDADECAAVAETTNPQGKALAGAIAGAVVAGLLGAATWRAGGLSGNRGASFGGAVGAIGGGAEGAAAGAMDYRTVLRNCMIGRGHIPLN